MMNAVKRLITFCIKAIRSACLLFSLSNARPGTPLVACEGVYDPVSYEKLISSVSAGYPGKYPVLYISVVSCLFIISVTNEQAIAKKSTAEYIHHPPFL